MTKSDLNYNDIKDIDSHILKDLIQLKMFLEKDEEYYILNDNFLKSFITNQNSNSHNNNQIEFYISHNKIEISNQGKTFLSFKTEDNIINKSKIDDKTNYNGLNENKNSNLPQTKNQYNSEFLYHLIKYVFFKKELFEKNVISTENNFNQGYLLKKELIKLLDERYNFNLLFKELKENKIIEEIEYKNYDENYSKISSFLNEKKTHYINTIKLYQKKF